MVRNLLVTSLMFAASSAIAQPMAAAAPMASGMANRGAYPPAGSQAWGSPSARAHASSRLRSTLRDLRTQALALRAADGGTITPEHLAFIQTRLDAAQASYRRYQSAPW